MRLLGIKCNTAENAFPVGDRSANENICWQVQQGSGYFLIPETARWVFNTRCAMIIFIWLRPGVGMSQDNVINDLKAQDSIALSSCIVSGSGQNTIKDHQAGKQTSKVSARQLTVRPSIYTDWLLRLQYAVYGDSSKTRKTIGTRVSITGVPVPRSNKLGLLPTLIMSNFFHENTVSFQAACFPMSTTSWMRNHSVKICPALDQKTNCKSQDGIIKGSVEDPVKSLQHSWSCVVSWKTW